LHASPRDVSPVKVSRIARRPFVAAIAYMHMLLPLVHLRPASSGLNAGQHGLDIGQSAKIFSFFLLEVSREDLPEASHSLRVQRAIILTTRTDLMTPESTVRARAKAAGLTVCKSRERTEHVNNCGQYMLINDRNVVVLGDRYNASLEAINEYVITSRQ
jgi:hypothetical protein